MNPDQGNLYLPWRSDPAGGMLLLGMVYGRNEKRGKWDQFLVVLIVALVVSLFHMVIPGEIYDYEETYFIVLYRATRAFM